VKIGQAGQQAEQKRGLRLILGKGNWTACHIGPNFTDEQFHNTGVAWRDGCFSDEGRFAVSKNPRERGAFKAPTLREIARTAPYMHDGSLAMLEDVIDSYSEGGRPNPLLDSDLRPDRFSPEEKRAPVAFLHTMSGRI
jgi:cytochrome c peroxidase